MFLNTQSGSVLLAACSRRELPAGLPFAHRLWDVMLAAGATLMHFTVATLLWLAQHTDAYIRRKAPSESMHMFRWHTQLRS